MPDIRTVGIIGAGPAGLAAVYELLHTSSKGESVTDTSQSAFSKIVAFEQQEQIGGIWNTKIDDPDLGLPPKQFLESETYNDANAIHPSHPIPAKLDANVHDYEHPLQTQELANVSLEWSKSAVYDGLFSNVPRKFLRFSTIPYDATKKDKLTDPFISYKEISSNLQQFAKQNGLEKHVRTSTQVEKAEKSARGGWVLTLRQRRGNCDFWYQEQFDALIVASGHYSVPFIPKIPGLAAYELKHPGTIVHNKAWRSPEPYRGKKVLFVGGSLSSLDIVQYVYPISKQTIISRRKREQVFPWLQKAAESEGIVNKPGIQRFLPESDEIEFVDGSRVSNVDKVVLATGYHWHYPFLHDNSGVAVTLAEDGQGVATCTSRVQGLYMHTFAIEDPTLAFMGVKLTTLKWPSIELEAAAIAGVWSNATKLPSREEQRQWEQDRVAQFGNNFAFHYTHYDKVKEEFLDKLYQFAPKNRPFPLEREFRDIGEIEESMGVLEDLFFKLKQNEITYEETL